MSLNSVSGRPVDSTPRQGPATAGNPINQPALRESGSDYQPEEIYLGSHPENKIFGLRNSLTLNDPIITIRENEKDPTGCSQAVDSVISVSERDSPICWESYSYNTSIAASPSLLQSTTVSVHLGNTQKGMNAKFNTIVQLDPMSKADPLWWQSLNRKLLSNPIVPTVPSATTESDASNKGWGAVLNSQTQTGGVW